MAKKNKGLTDDELATLCAREFEQADTYMGEIDVERADSLNAYNQEPYGNEEDGLSKFITSDVRDVIEWTKPQLVDIFVGGDAPVVFKGQQGKDAKSAADETAYCQYVITQQNKGVLLVQSWIHDALLQKNGIIKCFWEEKVSEEREEYTNKTYDEYMALDQDDEFEVQEITVCIDENELSENEFLDIIDALSTDPQAQMNVIHDAYFNLVGVRSTNVSQVKILNVPPENFFVRRNHNSIVLKDCTYCAEVYPMTRSDLVEQGYDRELVDSLPVGTQIYQKNSQEQEARWRKEGGYISQVENSGDRSRDIIMITDHFIRADCDGDGIAELRMVRTARNSAQFVLENERIDRHGYHAITPYLQTHKFFGRSLADNLMDIQAATTQMSRSMFDNFAYSAMPRKVVSGVVNMDDIMTYVLGGIIRKNADATIENDTIPFVAGDGLTLMDRLNSMRTERSGFSQQSMGLDPAALANSTTPIGMAILAQSQLLVKMIATIIAYTGYEDLMLNVRELVMKHEKGEKVFELTGSEITTDPRDWRKQRETKVKVGIGFAGRQEALATFEKLLTLQQTFVEGQGGLTGAMTNPGLIYNTVREYTSLMGIKDTENYFQDPATYKEPAPPPPSLAEVTLKGQLDKMNADVKNQGDQTLIDVNKNKTDKDLKLKELAQNRFLELAKIASQEKTAELELIYKYGKDAHEQVINTLGNLTKIVEGQRSKKEKMENDDENDTESPRRLRKSNPKK